MEEDLKENFEYIDEYRIVRVLGSGFSAEVKLAVDLEERPVAIKQFKQEAAALQLLRTELQVMRELSHQGLIRLIAVRESAVVRRPREPELRCCAIVLEYAGGGELFDFVAQTGAFSERVARSFFLQLMAGLHYMHERGYAHRDVKPENLLLSSSFALKLADFGFSCLIRGRSGTGVLRTKLGTKGYMAPEIDGKNYDGRRTDIFAAGVILFIMLAGNPPFESASPADPYYKLIREKRFEVFWRAHSRRRTPGFFASPFRVLIQRMLAYEPHERPTAFQIAEHPWVRGPVSLRQEICEEFGQRKKRLEVVVERRQKELQAERMRRTAVVQSPTSNGQELAFMQEYNTEAARGLKLCRLDQCSPHDICLHSSDCALIYSRLKRFLKHRCPPTQQGEQREGEVSPLAACGLRCLEVADEGDRILVKFEYQIEIEGEVFPSCLVFALQAGIAASGGAVLHCSLVAGSDFYLRVAAGALRRECWA